MSRVKLSVLLSVVVLMLVYVSTGCTQEYELKYKLPKGTTFTLKTSATEEQISDQMGQEVVININRNSESAVDVLSLDDKTGMTLSYEYTKRVTESDGPMGLNSTDYLDLLGKKVKFIINSTGHASGFEGFEELPEITSPNGQTTSGDDFIRGIKNLFPKMPEKTVKIGETWTDNQESEAGSLKTMTNFTYKTVEDVKKDGFDCLKIEIVYTQTVKGTLDQNGMEIALDIKGEGSGVMYFGYKKGMVIYSENTLKSEGTAEVEAGIAGTGSVAGVDGL